MSLLSYMKQLILLHALVTTNYEPLELTATFIAHNTFGTIAVAIKLSLASVLPLEDLDDIRR